MHGCYSGDDGRVLSVVREMTLPALGGSNMDRVTSRLGCAVVEMA